MQRVYVGASIWPSYLCASPAASLSASGGVGLPRVNPTYNIPQGATLALYIDPILRNSTADILFLSAGRVHALHCPLQGHGCNNRYPRQLSLYKIVIHFKALLWESIILLLPPPPAKPTLLQYYCTTIAQYTPPTPIPPFHAIHHTISVMAISCEGQQAAHKCTMRIFLPPVSQAASTLFSVVILVVLLCV